MQADYDAELTKFRAAARVLAMARAAYRAREIGDREFLAAKAEFNRAANTMDVAEKTFMELSK